MSIRRLYFGIESIALTAGQKQTLAQALEQLGDPLDPSPARRNHWRVRLDGDAILYEAAYDDSMLSVAQFKTWLAGIFGVATSAITNTTANPASGTVLTFSYLATPRLRVVLFGGVAATYPDSQAAAQAYLAANSAAWEPSA